MDERQIVRLRLHNQRLAAPSAGAGETDPAAIVSWFGAMQAQEYGPAKWSVGQRGAGLEDGALQRAVDEGRILRTHVRAGRGAGTGADRAARRRGAG